MASDWIRLRFIISQSTFRVFEGEIQLVEMDISAEEPREGGVYFFPYGDSTVRMRDPRLKALE